MATNNSQLDRIEQKFDAADARTQEKFTEITGELNKVHVQLALYNQSLDTHIKRTDLLEKSLDQTNEEIKPMQAHVHASQERKKTIKWVVGTLLVGFVTFLAEYFAMKH